MTLDELSRQFTSAYLGAAWAIGATALIVLTVGYLSLRFLRCLPDFPDKPAMIRGATWGGLVFTGLLVAAVAVAVAGTWLVHCSISSVLRRATPPVDPPQAGMGGGRQTAVFEAAGRDNEPYFSIEVNVT